MQNIPSFSYLHTCSLDSLPRENEATFLALLGQALKEGARPLAYFALPKMADETGQSLLAVLAQDGQRRLLALRSIPLTSVASLTPSFPALHLFERALNEEGMELRGHPWCKPVRVAPDLRSPGSPPFPFFRTTGSQVHEVAVGPVHAGIIEPGHFRFQCAGEEVIHLEIALGYQHRGLEALVLKKPLETLPMLFECTAGDTSIGHALAHALIIERLQNRSLSARVSETRALALELERLANHVGDLGAIAGDTGFLPTSAWNGRIRGDILTMTAILTGNRFGRNLVVPGTVRRSPDAKTCSDLEERRKTALRDARGAIDCMMKSPSVLERMRETGKVSAGMAKKLGLVGVCARASGIPVDARKNAPFEDETLPFAPALAETGDVLGRVQVRIREVETSFAMVEKSLTILSALEREPVPPRPPLRPLPKNTLAVSQVEGFRGEIVHVAVTNAENAFLTYRVIDPSFHNWMGLAVALRGNQISDFPLCNKSFNLSYCGHDL
ncbi:MAG: hydrogenase [Desulfovibrio sp.]|nr:hydrogenase [Desulfovibrio sp.]